MKLKQFEYNVYSLISKFDVIISQQSNPSPNPQLPLPNPTLSLPTTFLPPPLPASLSYPIPPHSYLPPLHSKRACSASARVISYLRNELFSIFPFPAGVLENQDTLCLMSKYDK